VGGCLGTSGRFRHRCQEKKICLPLAGIGILIFFNTDEGVTTWRGWEFFSYKAGGFEWYYNSFIRIWSQTIEFLLHIFGAMYLNFVAIYSKIWRQNQIIRF